ncbi:aminopeptidase P family protein [uncultured Rikenella sp.]|uniref:aminopeptidase P family protein n=1 Tax=uncultured Rikenella sp. TaxID=368003 RepID=UPI002636B9B3|nr:aminopeptidase P family protein [uncultured Rikenella sp.]
MIWKRLEKLRGWMREQRVGAFIVPSNDPHFSEYVAPHWGCRAWISGFDGSAGTVAVTADGRAALWTDSRYFLQAETQLTGTGIELQRMGLAGTPSLTDWLSACGISRVGVDGRLFSRTTFEGLKGNLAAVGIELTAVGDPFATIWDGRPALPDARAMVLDAAYSGEAAIGKLGRIRAAMSDGAVRIVAVLDEIAWALNIRGGDIAYNPVVVSYLAIEPERAILFVDRDKFTPDDRERLRGEARVEMRPYHTFSDYLGTWGGKTVIVDPNGLDQYHYTLLETAGARIVKEATPYGMISAMKAVKNPTEIAGFRRAMEVDGAALVRFEMWLEKIVKAGECPTELEIAAKLHEFRQAAAAKEGFRGESFETIAGYGDHGAIVHYEATPESDIPVGTDSFLLIDSGGQYLYGTTDITRTYHFGTPTAEQRQDYTAVLRGMIDLSAARFPVGTRGAQLDVLARRHLWNRGQNYLHGTGHGVGHFLCVHEGPQSIRMNENPVVLEPGMVQSCEPGLYLAGRYGIRIENLTLVTAEGCPEGFLRFEPLTLCPISLRAVDTAVLDADQREWLNDYHAKVYERLAPLLNTDEKQWLRDRTRPV